MPRRTVLPVDMRAATTRGYICLLMLATLAALAQGFPAAQEDDQSAGPLPFLQFTKGGIRVNFGGYHAQAGLGGLLTGSKADGGLHASAGTPNGPHASAGLGGSLDGGPAGGLHARAGLGNGGPEAAAGLGGTLAGPEPKGELYAGSSPGNLKVIGDMVNGILSADNSKGKNIQVISRPKKASEKVLVDGTTAAESLPNLKEPSPVSAGATANAEVSSDDDEDEAEKSQYPARWYFRKRLRERAGDALTTKTTSTTDNASSTPVQAAPASSAAPGTKTATTATEAAIPRVPKKSRPQGIFARAAATNVETDSSRGTKKGSLFDDIFNIPISALNAVNQLLRNHVGKK